MYCEPNTSNSHHTRTQFIQLLVLLPIYTHLTGDQNPGELTSTLLYINFIMLFLYFIMILNLAIGFHLSRRILLTTRVRNIYITLLEAAVYLIRTR